ncbi:MAG: SDR family oxidoreductase [Bacteroidia bacterium]|nr:SDR family oxidoreductase [Bacteroidia bacterium]
MKKTPFENTGFWALILGGSSGMGFATAQKLAKEGMNICVVYRDRRSALLTIEESFATIRKTGVKFISLNVNALQEEGMEKVMSEIGHHFAPGEKIRLLLHSLSRGNLNPLAALSSEKNATLSEDDFRQTIYAMAVSLLTWTRKCISLSLFAPDARVLGFTSEGNQRVWPGYAAVSAAKVTLESLMRSMAVEFAPLGIRTNLIQAGITDTPSLRMIPGNEDLRKKTESRNPFRRLTRPEDVADVVYLLCLDEAAWINGAIIPVDGGEKLL